MCNILSIEHTGDGFARNPGCNCRLLWIRPRLWSLVTAASIRSYRTIFIVNLPYLSMHRIELDRKVQPLKILNQDQSVSQSAPLDNNGCRRSVHDVSRGMDDKIYIFISKKNFERIHIKEHLFAYEHSNISHEELGTYRVQNHRLL